MRTIFHDDEKVIFILNDHWIIIIRPVFIIIIGWIAFLLIHQLSILLNQFSPDLSFILLIIAFCLLIVMHHWFFLTLIRWYVSNWYITDKRIIEFDNKPFIRNESRFIRISEIHEIEMKKRGFIANIFDYGTVTVNAAAMPEPMILKALPEPSKFVYLIEDIRTKQHYKEKSTKELQKIYGRKYKFID